MQGVIGVMLVHPCRQEATTFPASEPSALSLRRFRFEGQTLQGSVLVFGNLGGPLVAECNSHCFDVTNVFIEGVDVVSDTFNNALANLPALQDA